MSRKRGLSTGTGTSKFNHLTKLAPLHAAIDGVARRRRAAFEMLENKRFAGGLLAATPFGISGPIISPNAAGAAVRMAAAAGNGFFPPANVGVGPSARLSPETGSDRETDRRGGSVHPPLDLTMGRSDFGGVGSNLADLLQKRDTLRDGFAPAWFGNSSSPWHPSTLNVAPAPKSSIASSRVNSSDEGFTPSKASDRITPSTIPATHEAIPAIRPAAPRHPINRPQGLPPTTEGVGLRELTYTSGIADSATTNPNASFTDLASNMQLAWFGQVKAPEDGSYHLRVDHTNTTVSLIVDGLMISGAEGDRVFAAGSVHDVVVKLQTTASGASASLKWITPDSTTGVAEAVPTSQLLLPQDGSGDGLKWTSYTTGTLATVSGTGSTAQIDYTSSPAAGVRWLGQIDARYDESYTFTLGSGTLVRGRVWVNGEMAYDYPTNAVTATSIPILLAGGQRYDIRAEYVGGTIGTFHGNPRLIWSSASQPAEVVPQAELYTITGFTPRVSGAGEADSNGHYSITLDATGSGAGNIDHWTVDWGDGTDVETIAPNSLLWEQTVPNPLEVHHIFPSGSGTYRVMASAVLSGGTFRQASPISVNGYASGAALALPSGWVTKASKLGSDGSLAVAGVSPATGSNVTVWVAHLSADGTPDTTFGTSGFVSSTFSGTVDAVQFADDLSYYVLSRRITTTGGLGGTSTMIVELRKFGTNGTLPTGFPVTNSYAGVTGAPSPWLLTLYNQGTTSSPVITPVLGGGITPQIAMTQGANYARVIEVNGTTVYATTPPVYTVGDGGFQPTVRSVTALSAAQSGVAVVLDRTTLSLLTGSTTYTSAVHLSAAADAVGFDPAGASVYTATTVSGAVAVRHYASDLTPLTSGFGESGVAKSDSLGVSSLKSVATLSDGRIIVTGSTRGSGNAGATVISRFSASGAKDTSWGIGGIYLSDYGTDDVAAVAADGGVVQSDTGLNELVVTKLRPTNGIAVSADTVSSVATLKVVPSSDPHSLSLVYGIPSDATEASLEQFGPGDLNYRQVWDNSSNATPPAFVSHFDPDSYYSFRLRVVSGGYSYYAYAFGHTPVAPTSLAVPSNVALATTGSQVTFNWDPAAAGLTSADHFVVTIRYFESAGPTALANVDPEQQTFTFSGSPVAGNLYSIPLNIPDEKERAVFGISVSGESSPWVPVRFGAAPRAPMLNASIDLSVAATATGITASFGSAFSGHLFGIKDDNSLVDLRTVYGALTTDVATGSLAEIRAFVAFDGQRHSDIVPRPGEASPTMVSPSNVRAEVFRRSLDRKVVLSWADNANSEDHFVIDRNNLSAPTPSWTIVATLNADQQVFNDVVPVGEKPADDSLYIYRIKAVTAPQESDWSNLTSTLDTSQVIGDDIVALGSTYSLSLPNKNVTSSISWKIDWGDGSDPDDDGEIGEIVLGNPSAIDHIYSTAPGDYTINASAASEDGVFARAQVPLKVIPPIAAVGDSTVLEGENYTLNLFSDPSRPLSSWTVDWGDGSDPTNISLNGQINTFVTHKFEAGYGPFTVQAVAHLDGGGDVAVPSISVGIIAALPTDFEYDASSSTSFHLSWTNVSLFHPNTVVELTEAVEDASAVQYSLGVDTVAGDVTGLTPGGVYSIRLGVVQGDATNWDDGSYLITLPPGVTHAPDNVHIAGVADASVAIAWDDTNGGLVSYQIDRNDGPVSDPWIPVGVTGPGAESYTDYTASEGTPYQYRVRATNDINFGPSGNVVDATTLPFAPGNLQAFSLSATEVQLTWTDNSTGETGYRIEKSIHGLDAYSTAATLAADTTNVAVGGLSPNTIYDFKATAINAEGEVSFPATIQGATLPGGTLPSKPVGLTVDRTARTLSWSAASNASSYYVQWKTSDNAAWTTVSATTTTLSIADLWDDDRTLRFRVIGHNTYGDGVASDVSTVTTTVDAPTGVTAGLTSGGDISLTWNNSAANATEYWVWQTNVTATGTRQLVMSTPANTGQSSFSRIIGGVTPGVVYSFEVQAITPDLASAFAASNTVSPSPKSVAAAGDTTTHFGNSYSVTLSSANINTELAWTINWGDGTPTVVAAGISTAGGTLVLSHVYADSAEGANRTYAVTASAVPTAGGAGQVVFYANPLVVDISESNPPGALPPGDEDLAKRVQQAILEKYDEVYNTVMFEPYFGFQKSPEATLSSRGGNDWDQTALLKDEISTIAAKFGVTITTSYSLETITTTYANLERVLGVKTELAVTNVLDAAQIGYSTVSHSGDTLPTDPVTLDHMVLVVDDSTPSLGLDGWTLDPSWKYLVVQDTASRINTQIGSTAASQFKFADFISQTTYQSPLLWYENKVTDYLRSQSGTAGALSLADLAYTRGISGKNIILAGRSGSDFTNVPLSEYSVVSQSDITPLTLHFLHNDVEVSLYHEGDDSFVGDSFVDVELTGTIKIGDITTTTTYIDYWMNTKDLQSDVLNITYTHSDSTTNLIPSLYLGQSLLPLQQSLVSAGVPVDSEMRLSIKDRSPSGLLGTITHELDDNPGIYYRQQGFEAPSQPRSLGDPFAAFISFGQYSTHDVLHAQEVVNTSFDSISNAVAGAIGHTVSASQMDAFRGYQTTLLDLLVVKYAYESDQEVKTIADINGALNLHPEASVGFVYGANIVPSGFDGGLINPVQFYQAPFGSLPARGIQLDLPFLKSTLPPIDASYDRAKSIVEALGSINSFLEADVIHTVLNQEAVSSVTGLQYEINVSNAALGVLTTASDVNAYSNRIRPQVPDSQTNAFDGMILRMSGLISGAMAQSVHEIFVPRKLVTMYQWTGAAYVFVSNGGVGDEIVHFNSSSGGDPASPPNVYVAPASNKSAKAKITGDPVNEYSGALIYDESLLSLPTAGLPFGVSIHYDTQFALDSVDFTGSNVDSGLGVGWSTNFSDMLDLSKAVGTPTVPGIVVWRDWRGQRSIFTSGVNGSYTNPSGLFGTFTYSSTTAEYQYSDTIGSREVFDSQGRLISIVDRNQNRITLSYPSREIDAVYQSSDTGSIAREIVFSLDPAGHITSIADDTHRVWNIRTDVEDGKSYLKSIEFDPNQDVEAHSGIWSGTVGSDATVTIYDYGSASLVNPGLKELASVTRTVGGLPMGEQFYSYYPNGKVFSTKNPLEQVEYFSYSQFISAALPLAAGSPTTSTTHIDYDGNSTTTFFNNQGLTILTVNPDQSQTSQSWFHYGDPKNVNDGKYLVQSQTNEVGLSTFYGYDAGTKLSNPNPTTIVSGSLSDPSNKAAAAKGLTQKLTYDPRFGGVAEQEIIAPGIKGSRITSNSYDASTGNLLSTKDPAGNVTSFSYTGSGLIVTKTLPRTGDALYSNTYDSYGQLVSVVRVGTTVTNSYQCDPRGNLLSTTDAAAGVVDYRYDASGRQREISVHLQGTIAASPATVTTIEIGTLGSGYQSKTASTVGTEPSESDGISSGASGLITVEITNTVSELVQSSTNGRSNSYTYDPNGNPLTLTDALGNVTRSRYDSRGRVNGTFYADGGFVRSQYDGTGRVTVTETPLGTATPLGSESVAITKTVYNSQGYVGKVIDPLLQQTTYTYDGFGELTSTAFIPGTGQGTSISLGTKATRTLYNTAFDSLGRVTEQRDDHGVVTSIHYDPDGNVDETIRYDVSNVSSFWNAKTSLSGFVKSQTTKQDGADPRQFSSVHYDSLGRPVAVRDNLGYVTQTVYDGNGRVIASIDARGTNSFGTATVSHEFFIDATHYPVGNSPTTVSTSGNIPAYETIFVYDLAGRLAQKILPSDAVQSIAAHGHIDYVYYDDGRLKSETNPATNSMMFTYMYGTGTETGSLATSITTRTDAFEKTAVTTKDASGNIVSTVDQNGQTTTYTFDSRGRLLTTALPVPDSGLLAPATQNAYDLAGNLVRTTDVTGVTAENLNPDTSTDRLETSYTYDALGRVLTTTQQDVTDTTVSLSSTANFYRNNELFAQRDGNGNVIFSFTQYPLDNPDQKGTAVRTTAIRAAGSVIDYTSSALTVTKLLKKSDIVHLSQTTISALGTVLADRVYIDSNGSASAQNKTSSNLDKTTGATNSSYRLTSYLYDGDNRLAATLVNPQSSGSVNLSDPNRPVTYYRYDAVGNLIAEIGPRGAVLANPLQSVANAVSIDNLIASNTFTTTYQYDAFNRRILITDPDPDNFGKVGGPEAAAKTHIKYDFNANVKEQVDADHNTITYSYDEMGRLTNTYAAVYVSGDANSSENTTTSYSYSPTGILKQVIDANGRKIVYGLDNLGRVKSETWYSSAGTNLRMIDSTYDQQGRPTAIGNSHFTYDAFGRITQNGDGIAYTYDANGNRLSMIVPAILPVTNSYSYDQFDQLTSVWATNSYSEGDTPGITYQKVIATDFEYNLAGQLSFSNRKSAMIKIEDEVATVEEPMFVIGGTTQSYLYDAVGRTTAVLGAQEDYRYVYNLNGETVQFSIKSTIADSYTYDGKGQLTNDNAMSSWAGSSATHTYDANNNRQDAGTVIGAGNRLVSNGTFSYTYDKVGNMVSKVGDGQDIEFTYDNRNRLTGVVKTSDQGETDVTYVYKDDDSRTEVLTTTTATGSTDVHHTNTKYWNDGLNIAKVSTTVDGTGSTQVLLNGLGAGQTFGAMDDTVVVTPPPPITGSHPPPGKTVGWYVYLADRLGSVRNVLRVPDVSGPGELVNHLKYDASGGFKQTRSGESTYSPVVTYAGEVWDGAITDNAVTLFYVHARYYDPSTGRFITVDPARDGVNWYVYAGNNPVDFTDPTGLSVGSTEKQSSTESQASQQPGYFTTPDFAGIGNMKVKSIVKPTRDGGYDVTGLFQLRVGEYVAGLPSTTIHINPDSGLTPRDIMRRYTDTVNDYANVTDSEAAAQAVTNFRMAGVGLVAAPVIAASAALSAAATVVGVVGSGEEIGNSFQSVAVGNYGSASLEAGRGLFGLALVGMTLVPARGGVVPRPVAPASEEFYFGADAAVSPNLKGASYTTYESPATIPGPSIYGGGGSLTLNPLAANAGGRLGTTLTREHVANVAGELESRGWTITGGGGQLPEEYLPGPGGARRGSSYPDITATKNGKTLRVNTVDTYVDGTTPTIREATNAARIRAQTPGDHLLIVPKPKPNVGHR